MKHLSKSKVVGAQQCPKKLWLELYKPGEAEVTESAEDLFETGNRVGELARQMYGEGRLVSPENDLSLALKESRQLIDSGFAGPIYEATFSTGGILVRLDVLLPDGDGHRIVEVKSSTEVKEVHLLDCAIQCWVARQSGLTITRVALAHIDTAFVYPGNGRYEGLLKEVDVTAEIEPIIAEVPALLASAQLVAAGAEPERDMGSHCRKPYDCGFMGYCKRLDGSEYPVSILPNGGKTIEKLRRQGYRDLRDVPDGQLKSRTHQRVWRVTQSGVPELNTAEASAAIQSWAYPRYYLDFETLGEAIPIWAGTRPYERIPFQWSCHVEDSPGVFRHQGFLADGTDAPMRACAETLVACIGDHGAVIAYNASFEIGVLNEQAQRYPDLAPTLTAIAERVVDLLPVAKAAFYAPSMMGSWSIKRVLPALVPELRYDALDDVQHGIAAQQAFREIMAPQTAPERRQQLRESLEAYCTLDTWAMVRIAERLSNSLEAD